MLNLRYVGSKIDYSVSFSKMSDNLVEVKGNLPAETTGFHLSRIGMNDEWNYTGFTTIYREIDGGIQFSNDGSVYVEPHKIMPVITFMTQTGGTLEGETRFETDNWNEVVVPTPIAENGFVFAGWLPELPENEEITESMTYTAMFEDHHVYFVASEGGYLDGETSQFVNNYAELLIPEPVENEGYKFTGWSPEIPVEGTVDYKNPIFTAMFKYTIPEDVAALKEDMAALNEMWGGNE